MELKELTKAEEEIMMYLWKLKNAYIKDILDKFPEPKPAYNTVSTIVRILAQKGFIGHEAFGKTHRYYALIEKQDYRVYVTDKLKSGYFKNSVSEMMSFFVKNDDLDIKDIDEIMALLSTLKSK